MAQYQKSQLRPCSSCDLEPATCGKRYRTDVPNKETSVMCIKFGAVEIIDMSELDKVARISIRRNGRPITNTETSGAAAAGL